MSKQHYMTRQDAATYAGVSVRSIDRLIRDGTLKRFRLRGRTLVAREQLERVIQTSATVAV